MFNPLDYILKGAKGIVNKGKSAVLGFLDAPDNSTQGIVRNTIAGIAPTAKEFIAPTRGYSEAELRKAKPTIKDTVIGAGKGIAEISTGLGQLGAMGANYLPGYNAVIDKLSKTKVGNKLADVSQALSDYSVPETVEQAKAMRVFDIASNVLPVGKTKNLGITFKAIADSKDLTTISKELLNIGVKKEVIPSLAPKLIDITNPKTVGDIVTQELYKPNLAQEAITAAENKGKGLPVLTPEQTARENFSKTWNDAYGDRPATIESPSQLQQRKVEPLAEEAKKYKSAEEFVKAKENRQTTSYTVYADRTGDGKSPRLEVFSQTEADTIVKDMKDMGFSPLVTENNYAQPTKSQLTDIYNQATKGKGLPVLQPSVEEFVKGTKVMEPDGTELFIDGTEGADVLLYNKDTNVTSYYSKDEVRNLLDNQDRITSNTLQRRTDLSNAEATKIATEKEYNNLYGFEGRTPMETGKFKSTLNEKLRRSDGTTTTRKDSIIRRLKEGYTPNEDLTLLRPKGSDAGVLISKAEGKFAKYLIDNKKLEVVPTPEKPHLKLDSEGKPLAYTAREKELLNEEFQSNPAKPNLPEKSIEQTNKDPLSIIGKARQSLTPTKVLEKDTEEVYKTWTRELEKAKVLGNKELNTINIPNKDGFKAITDHQSGIKTPVTEKIKTKFDDLFEEAKKRGLKVEYRENYLPQVYRESPVEIQDKIAKYLKEKKGMSEAEVAAYQSGNELPADKAKRLKLEPFFSKERSFPDYKTAMEYGLTPKYTNPNQLIGHYRKELETTLANQKFIQSLRDKKKIVPASAAPSDWVAVNLPFSTKGFYAEPRLARTLNEIFTSDANKTFMGTISSGVATASRRAQELALSAGLPRTNVNFFSIGQVIKEMTAGNFKAVVPFLRSNFNEASVNYFKNNHKYLEMMADEGLRLGDHIGTLDNAYKNIIAKDSIFKKFGIQFDKAFNEKTFGSFMPQMYTQTFKDIYSSALKKGLSESEAKLLAGDTVKNAFGLMENMGRSKATEDALSAVFFAPKFREGIINTLTNTGKAGVDFVKNIGGLRGALNPALSKNRKLLAGMIVTYGLYNAINYKLNGNFMWDNPTNRKFALQIPRKNGELVYLEFMPSFLAFARNMIQGTISLGTGDFSNATQKLGSVFSIPVKTTTEVVANKDYFGNEIYKETDSGLEKSLKIAKYVGLAVNHPYVKEVINQIQDKKPLHQSVVAGLELPLKFSSVDKVKTQNVYDIITKQKAKSEELKSEAQKLLEDLKKLPKDEANAKATDLKKSNPLLYEKLKNEIEAEKLGLTSLEKGMRQLGVENGERALYIWDELQKLKTAEEKNAYMKNLKEKKIVTDNVFAQLKKIKGSN